MLNSAGISEMYCIYVLCVIYRSHLYFCLEEHADDVRDTASHIIVWQIVDP